MKKQFLATMLSLCLLAGSLPVTAFAADPGVPADAADAPVSAVSENTAAITIGQTLYDTLQAAVDAASDTDAVITISAGELNLGETKVEISKKVTIQGAGSDTIIKGTNTADYSIGMLTFNGGSEGSVLKDLTIAYTATGAQSQAVYFNYGFTGGSDENKTVIEHVDFVGAESLDAIGQETAIASTYIGGGYVDITGCTFQNFKYAMYFNQISNVNITNNKIDGTKYNAINIAADSADESGKCENIVISGNTLTNISSGNYASDEYSSAIRIGSNVAAVEWKDNSIAMLNDKLPVYNDNEAKIGAAYYATLSAAISAAAAGDGADTIDLLKHASSDAIELPADTTLNGNGYTLIYSGSGSAESPANGAFLTAGSSADRVVIQNLTVDTQNKIKHGVQFYCSTDGKLNGVTVNGGAYTSVVVNGASGVEIKNCDLNPAATAYANIEYGMGSGVTTIPSVSVSDSTMEPSKVQVYVDEATVRAVQANTAELGEGADEADVLKAIAGKVVGAEVVKPVPAAGDQGLQRRIDEAEAGAVIDLQGQYYTGTLNISKPITLKNGRVDNVNIIGNPEKITGVTLDKLTFMGSSTTGNLDVNASSLYVQNADDVTVKNCVFNGPMHDQSEYTTAITTHTVDGFKVETSKISNYTMSAYHNAPSADITYSGNTFMNIESGIAFDGTAGAVVTGNTFDHANGIRLRSTTAEAGGEPCSDVTIAKNKFLSSFDGGNFGSYAIRLYADGVAEGKTLNLNRNYWGSSKPNFNTLIVKESGVGTAVDTTHYYVSEAMNRLNTDSSSGGGGGGSSVSVSYTVSVPDKIDNGTVTVSPKSASRGDTVTITVKPDSGYELDTLTAVAQNGDKIKLTDKGDGKYTFTMPAYKIEIKASFAKADPAAFPFVDVASSAYYYNAVKWAVENKITSGTTAATFSPNASCTRAQMVTFLWRAAGSPASKGTVNPFTDVQAGTYYYDAVLWAIEQGITVGTSADAFSPDAVVNRGQTVTFLYRAAGSPSMSGSNPFDDVAEDSYCANAVLWAAKNEITTGTTATAFSPNADCTRAQIVTFLYRSAAE